MKKVVKDTIDTCHPSECKPASYYGVSMNDELFHRSFIMYKDESFHVISTKDLTETYSYSGKKTMNLDEYIEHLLDSDCQVYQFETFRELSKWLNS